MLSYYAKINTALLSKETLQAIIRDSEKTITDLEATHIDRNDAHRTRIAAMKTLRHHIREE